MNSLVPNAVQLALLAKLSRNHLLPIVEEIGEANFGLLSRRINHDDEIAVIGKELGDEFVFFVDVQQHRTLGECLLMSEQCLSLAHNIEEVVVSGIDLNRGGRVITVIKKPSDHDWLPEINRFTSLATET